MADRQLQPFENVELGEKQDQLQVFEKAVLEHEGKGSAEDSGMARCPKTTPAANVCSAPPTKPKKPNCKSNC